MEDLAVGCDGDRLYLVAMSLGRRVEPIVPHALNLRHTHPVVRFVAELARSLCAVLRGFDWGGAASLPFLPRLRAGRTVISPALWRVDAAELPDRRKPWGCWRQAWRAWRERRRVPDTVEVGRGDRRLQLDLTEPAHLALLREHIDTHGQASLSEAPTAGAYGWCADRPTEVVIPLAATSGPCWSAPTQADHTVADAGDRSHRPALSRWIKARLHTHPRRRKEILNRLPALWKRWGHTRQWWFTVDHGCLNLVISLPEAAEFGHAAACLSAWGEDLRRARLAGGVEFTTYTPETGRWGTGAAMQAVEHAFAADADAVLAQFTHQPHAEERALVAAHMTAIARAVTGSTSAGMSWLIDHACPTPASDGVAREVRQQAVRLASPDQDWAALRAVPGGEALVEAWTARDEALAAYRAVLDRGQGPRAETVLRDLLHAHHLRVRGPDVTDEQACLRLARAAALAWTNRDRGGSRP